MYYRISSILVTFICLFSCVLTSSAQDTSNTDETEKPVILYSGTPKKYEIADIKVVGAKNYEDYVIIGLSGLSKGQTITVPGDEITQACKRYWRHGLFSDVQVTADKIEGDRIWLTIHLTMRPRVSDIRYHGVKKSEREDLEARVGLIKGNQITPNLIDRAKTLIKRYFDDKGFKNADIIITQKDDPNNENQVLVDINIDKKEKVKVHQITITGNQAITTKKLKRVMKKTNEKGKLLNLFRTKKFVEENFEADKQLIIDKYNELGYRDAMIVKDSIKSYDDRTVDIFMEIEEGQKYYLRNVTWVGNTLYPSEQLNFLLRMKKGDVYNQKLLEERTSTDEDAIGNLYYNNGYLFYSLDPVEVNIVGDSIDLEMRIFEGRQATINKVSINGNDRLYENVVRRELRTRPGQLFSREDLMRSMREIQQMGHFDPEQIQPDIQPKPEDGTVDIGYDLVSKANDQVEFSAGWGQTGIIGKLSLKFTNFSVANLLHPGENYRGILPQGDGQTLTISGQTNAKYYQSSVSFYDPWFGGKRPNAFSVSAFYSRQTDISSRYYNDAYMNSYYNSYYSGMYGYGMYNYGNYNNYENYYDPDKSIQMWGLAVMFGKRLKWPDDYFQFTAELSYQRYILSDWQYFPVTNGKCNNLSINLTLSRSSIDNPIYPRQGSEFSLSAQLTPPYSLFDGTDYSKYSTSNQDDMNKMHKWIEYHKWKFKSKVYIPLMDPIAVKRTPVLMGRVEFGLLGHYNKYKKSPFETFDVGGDGMTGYSSYATESVALRGYENSSLTPYGYEGYAYARLGLELRYPLMLETSTSIYALTFVEAGNAWHDVNKFNPFDLKRSAGVGVRIFLPMIGMMGIDWAYGFDKVLGSKQYGGSQFHFILGQEF
ncbi:outer membrane protein assembly factor BamA [Bacteroides stercoris]|uniref:outer membrane protein assembly factor BamA n=1 Tax=Bacteroides stercoris TaxID=46506 RepID=UPI001CD0286D|nr:outer membrane protein assembly factor BamA [Bacteroides stercoris]UBE40566.1 outer membrane protein assembly factor BamA [Bacteroides stercoris]